MPPRDKGHAGGVSLVVCDSFQVMANVKTTSYIDAVNNIARDNMRADLRDALAPHLAQIVNLTRGAVLTQEYLRELVARIDALEARIEAVELLPWRRLPALPEGGAPTPQDPNAS